MIGLTAYCPEDIYKIDLLEALILAKKAWDEVSPETIKHCWDHTQIQTDNSLPSTNPGPHADLAAWEIICDFTATTMSLPSAKNQLQLHLGSKFSDSHWRTALKAAMDAEGDIAKAVEVVNTFMTKTIRGQWLPRLLEIS
ncbi:hypothetical protein PAXRUDRAFT_158989 [Paxillus rubicundulus Ve08.2h10]|uniref:Uncharacterized protein n=1 Tax=Paxillus rubicundulus Ve08.2h10 TaxID=930991 RepID=A0A0D0D966_9AGAM|nr:hypothetical protein PAXRUDRAFT_158989 [Paxillus rubicundulus Ve08.2h10]